jgi:hypothetical protein
MMCKIHAYTYLLKLNGFQIDIFPEIHIYNFFEEERRRRSILERGLSILC